MLDENISWKEHIKTVENKISKKIGLLCKTKQLLDNESLKSIYFSYIHSYLNYANIAWASTNPTKLKKIHYLQKQAAQIFNEDWLCHSWPFLKNLNALNVYQINFYQNLNFMHRIKMGNILQRLPLLQNDNFSKCVMRHRLRIFLFCRKVMFRSQDIQVFVFLSIPWFSKSVMSWWILVHETGCIFEHIFWTTIH